MINATQTRVALNAIKDLKVKTEVLETKEEASLLEKEVDDGKLSASETFSSFAKGFSNGIEGMSDSFTSWLNDEDKISTDGNDNGKISFKEALASMGKGAMSLVKTAIKHPIATALTVGGTVAIGAGLIALTGGAAAPWMIAAGLTFGAGQIGVGTYNAVTAKTDGDAKRAYETVGSGLTSLILSAAGAKTALNSASKAGVQSAQLADDASLLQANLQVFKSLPEAVKVGAANTKGNILTWATGSIHANSNVLRNNSYSYTSKANDVQAYRFNGSGSADDILANNPGVFQGDDGNFYIANKWSPNEPYLIDTSKEQMIMMYDGTDDMAVCAGDVFKSSYVDQTAFKANGTQNYLDPTDLNPGEIINATKQAKGSFATAPTGSKIQTLEGVRTLQSGEVIAIDTAGNPYASPASNILKRNTDFSGNGQAVLETIKNGK